jgi:hypothetical protein
LNEYAAPANGGYGRYPWTAPTDLSFSDTSQLFGRVPDYPFSNTHSDSGNSMKDTWSFSCNINASTGWWINWRELVFYGLASAYKPVNPPTTPTSCGLCLTVNTPSAAINKKFVVIVAGKTLPGKARSSVAEKGDPANYLEPPNNTPGTTTFVQGAPTTTFNDTVVFQ